MLCVHEIFLLLHLLTYSYTRRSGQGQAIQHNLCCLLLGAPEEAGASGTSCYCMGVHKGIETQVKAMAMKLQEGVALKLSKVTFDGSVTAAYIHTPHAVVVDMSKTTIHVMTPAELLRASRPSLTHAPLISLASSPRACRARAASGTP